MRGPWPTGGLSRQKQIKTSCNKQFKIVGSGLKVTRGIVHFHISCLTHIAGNEIVPKAAV